ncbi:hypothetical protein TorRG33x02_274410 [Trema orientale]|uniref:Uncharacterized protein n=1 Tax=Trema orientale TaxID=63057 RepID=A0A2P5CSS2_TREOI|nr:hypothetical protein TorRG33x02_274410 [Trema orientale]
MPELHQSQNTMNLRNPKTRIPERAPIDLGLERHNQKLLLQAREPRLERESSALDWKRYF